MESGRDQASRMPGVWQSIVLCVVFWVLDLAVLFSGMGLRALTDRVPNATLGLPQLVAWPITLSLGLRWSRTSLRAACPVRRIPLVLVPALLVAGFGVSILLMAAATWVPAPEIWQRPIVEEFTRLHRFSVLLVGLGIAPVAEEVFFRGLVLRGYAARYGIQRALWGSALLFGAFHVNHRNIVLAAPAGLALGWLVLRTGSLLPAILGHAVLNLTVLVLIEPLGVALGYEAEQLHSMQHIPPSMLCVAAAAAGIGGLILGRQVDRMGDDGRERPVSCRS